MENFKKNYESLIDKLGNGVNLSAVLDFISYFRCDDVELYKEFLENYKEVGCYDSNKLVELYCKSEKITLSDENAPVIFAKLVKNIWDDNMSYHLTTSVSAKNISETGMDPSQKEEEVVSDICSLASLLSEDNRKEFFLYALNDIDQYYFSYIPKLGVDYGKKPEWFLELTKRQDGSIEEILPSILKSIENESEEAKIKMVEVVSKYHDLYKDCSRTLIVIPGLTEISSKDIIDSNNFKVDSVSSLEEGVFKFLHYRRSKYNESTDKVVLASELAFIDVSSKKIVDFNNINKTI